MRTHTPYTSLHQFTRHFTPVFTPFYTSQSDTGANPTVVCLRGPESSTRQFTPVLHQQLYGCLEFTPVLHQQLYVFLWTQKFNTPYTSLHRFTRQFTPVYTPVYSSSWTQVKFTPVCTSLQDSLQQFKHRGQRRFTPVYAPVLYTGDRAAPRDHTTASTHAGAQAFGGVCALYRPRPHHHLWWCGLGRGLRNHAQHNHTHAHTHAARDRTTTSLRLCAFSCARARVFYACTRKRVLSRAKARACVFGARAYV